MKTFICATLVTLGFLLQASRPVYGAGMIMHMELSNRAIEYFKSEFDGVDIQSLLRKHQDAYQTGAVFPDAFYSPLCLGGRFEDLAARTHNMEYIEAALDYWKKEYRSEGGFTEELEKLLAFILGNVAHAVQDIAWHGYGIDQGFMSTVSETNFNGNFSATHETLDYGGDAATLFGMNFINLHLSTNQYYLPRSDLYNIYKDFVCPGIRPCDEIQQLRLGLLACTRFVMSRAFLHKSLLDKFYIGYAMQAPLLASPRFQDYFVGGMSDMASWSLQRLETAIRYLKDDKQCQNTGTDGNPLYWMCGDQPQIKPPPASWLPSNDFDQVRARKRAYAERVKRSTDRFIGNPKENPEFYGTDEDLIEVIENKETGSVVFKPKGKLRQVVQKSTIDDLLAFGQLRKQNQVVNEAKPDKFAPKDSDYYKYFLKKSYTSVGQTLVSADVNKDGADDLIVGVPGYSEENKLDIGRVYVVMATERGLPSTDVDLETAQVIEAPFQGSGRFGYSAVTLDFNADSHVDIAISAPVRSDDVIDKPYSGFVYIYFGQSNGKFNSTPDVTIDCNMRYCNFGTSLSAGDVNDDGTDDLIVGSPYASRSFSENRQNGMVSVFYGGFKVKHNYHSYSRADVVVWGISEYSWFGTSAITTSFCDLLIGAPGQKTVSSSSDCSSEVQMAGAVYCYRLKSETLHTFARGSVEFEYFGAQLAEGHPNGKDKPAVVAISAPHADVVGKILGLLPYLMRQAGVVHLFNSETQLHIGQLDGDRLYGGFGQVIKFANVDKDEFDDLIVSAPARSRDVTSIFYGYGIGELYLYYGRNDFPTSALAQACQRVEPCPWSQADGVFSARLRKAHFGSSIAFLESTNVTQLVIAQQRTDDYGRQSGKLLLYNNCLSLNTGFEK